MAERAELAYLIEMGTPTAHPMVKDVVRIGRDPTNDILIRDATVSRLHAEVRLFGVTRSLSVVGSTGARVNDERVTTPMVLSAGDRIEIGNRTFVYQEGALPPGISVYAGHGPDIQSDPLLATTTVSNPVIVPVPAGTNGSRLRWIGGVVAVALALVLGFCTFMPRAH
jgi:hypothetical protein